MREGEGERQRDIKRELLRERNKERERQCVRERENIHLSELPA